MPAKRSLLILLAVTALLSIAVALRVPMSYPMPRYLADAVEWSTLGRIPDTFTPLAYPLFAGMAYRIAGIHGLLALQVLLQIAIAAVSYGILRELRLPPKFSAYGALPVALYPELLLSVAKAWDLALSTFLLLLFVLLCLRIARGAPLLSMKLTAATGLVFAAAIFCRPNLILLLPVVLVLLLHPRARLSRAEFGGHLIVFLAITAVGFALFGVASHGFAFFPRNGPYNLYAGHNSQTMPALLHDLNAENSIAYEFEEAHPGVPTPDLYSQALGSSYTRQSIHFAHHHPGLEIKLFFVKLFTLFRPDTKTHSLLSAFGVMKSLLALPALLFLATLLLPGRPSLLFEDKLLFAVELLYILPFLITNSDPRFRVSLDALLLLHAVSLLYWRRAARLAFASSLMAQNV
jgi:hypothetical protein